MKSFKKYVLIITLLFSPVLAINLDNYINENNCNQILDKEYFEVCYDYKLKGTKAVSYTLYGDLVNQLNIKKRPSFKVEKEISRDKRASSSDYTKSGYDRGHLACDASFDWSKPSLDVTYKLSNIIPQARKVNRYTWIKAERYERFIAVKLGEVSVINIVEYPKKPKYIGKHKIAVPSGFYKILYNKDKNYERCLYYKNDNNINTKEDRLKQHSVSCESLNFLNQ